jgi:hypothetical protein
MLDAVLGAVLPLLAAELTPTPPRLRARTEAAARRNLFNFSSSI